MQITIFKSNHCRLIIRCFHFDNDEQVQLNHIIAISHFLPSLSLFFLSSNHLLALSIILLFFIYYYRANKNSRSEIIIILFLFIFFLFSSFQKNIKCEKEKEERNECRVISMLIIGNARFRSIANLRLLSSGNKRKLIKAKKKTNNNKKEEETLTFEKKMADKNRLDKLRRLRGIRYRRRR